MDKVFGEFSKDEFFDYFEKKVKDTIKKFKLFTKKDKICVAVSGGKDSLTVLYLLKKCGYNVEALAVDEGIKGYRADTLTDLKKFCSEQGVELKQISFREEFGIDLDEAVPKLDTLPCTACGIFRRYLLNKYSRNYNILVTGHNMDDEVQSIVMNYVQHKLEMSARLGPKTGIATDKKFTQRVKPLYFCTEKEVRAYALLKGFDVSFTECPYAHKSFRFFIGEKMNGMEQKHPGAKRNIVDHFLGILPGLKKEYGKEDSVRECTLCGEPSRDKVCSACLTVKRVEANKIFKKAKISL